MCPAVLQGEHVTETGIYSFSNLEFALYNETKASAITEFEVQSPYLVLAPGVADAGDRIQIKAEDRTGQMEAGYTAVELDEQRCGSAEIKLLENGSFQVQTQPSENENRVMVFRNTENMCKVMRLRNPVKVITCQQGNTRLFSCRKQAAEQPCTVQ